MVLVSQPHPAMSVIEFGAAYLQHSCHALCKLCAALPVRQHWMASSVLPDKQKGTHKGSRAPVSTYEATVTCIMESGIATIAHSKGTLTTRLGTLSVQKLVKG